MDWGVAAAYHASEMAKARPLEDGKLFANHSIRWRLLDWLLEHEAEILDKWFVHRERHKRSRQRAFTKGAVIFTFASHDDIRRFLAPSAALSAASSAVSPLPDNGVFVSQQNLFRRPELSGTTDWKGELTQYAAQMGLLIVRVENATCAFSTTPVPQRRRPTSGDGLLLCVCVYRLGVCVCGKTQPGVMLVCLQKKQRHRGRRLGVQTPEKRSQPHNLKSATMG